MYGIQTPRIGTTVPQGNSAGDIVGRLLEGYNINLDQWQRNILTDGLAEQNNKWLFGTCAVSVPRQAGKTMLLEARVLAGLLLFDEQFIVVSSHEVRTTSEIFRRIRGYFDDIPELKALVKRVSLRNGEEAIELHTGQRVRFMSRSRNAGRGFSADVLLLDEAQELSEEAWASILPTTIASPNAQIWLFGTPPAMQNDGTVFSRVRKQGLNNESGIYYAEWSADPDLDLDDIQGWLQANPAIGYRVAIEQMREFRSNLSDEAFMREILGQWSSSASKSVIDDDTWQALVMDGVLDEHAAIWLSIDVSPDRSATSVSLAQVLDDGNVAVALLERRQAVTWAVEYVAGICSRRNVVAVAVDSGAAAGSLIEHLEARQVPLLQMRTNDVKRAAGRFYDRVFEGTVRHFGDSALNAAVAGGRKRIIGDAWGWNKATASLDITPLVAATNAVWATEQAKPTKAKPASKVSKTFYSYA